MAAPKKPRQRVCALDVTLESVRGRIHVELTCDGKMAGELNAYDVHPTTLRPDCLEALERLSARVGRPLTPYVVFRSWLEEDLRGSGVGSVMYVAAAEGAARLGAALIQHSCFLDPEDTEAAGTTSDVARWVWEGGRFGDHVELQGGRAAYLPESRWGRALAMLQFGQIEFGVPTGRRNKNPVRELGPALRQAVRGREDDVLSGRGPLSRVRWSSGGCAVLAVALRRWYPGFTYAGVVQDDNVHHVLVRYGDLYFDAEGVSTKKQLLNRWRKSWPRARVVSLEKEGPQGPVVPDVCEIPIQEASVGRTTDLLTRQLGTPPDWGFRQANPSYRLSGAQAECAYGMQDGKRTRICTLVTDNGRPVNLVQLRQLLAMERF